MQIAATSLVRLVLRVIVLLSWFWVLRSSNASAASYTIDEGVMGGGDAIMERFEVPAASGLSVNINSVWYVDVRGDFNLNLNGLSLEGLQKLWQGKGGKTQEVSLERVPEESPTTSHSSVVSSSNDVGRLIKEAIPLIPKPTHNTRNPSDPQDSSEEATHIPKPTSGPTTTSVKDGWKECTTYSTTQAVSSNGSIVVSPDKSVEGPVYGKPPQHGVFLTSLGHSTGKRETSSFIILLGNQFQPQEVESAFSGVDLHECRVISDHVNPLINFCPQSALARKSRSKRAAYEKEEYTEPKGWAKFEDCNPAEVQYAVDPSRTCSGWQDWVISKDKSRICTIGTVCEANHYYRDDKCVKAPETVEVERTCSTSTFNLASSGPPRGMLALDSRHPRICDLDGYPVSKCIGTEKKQIKVSYVGYNGVSYLVTKEHNFKIVPDMKDLRNYVCSNCSDMGCANCSGDKEYSQNFDAPIKSSCECKVSSWRPFSSIEMTLEGATYPLEFRFSKTIRATFKVQKPDDPIVACETCKIECDGNVIKLSGSVEHVEWIKMCVSTVCSTTGLQQLIQVPAGLLLFSKRIKVWIGGAATTKTSTFEAVCNPKTDCDLIKCWFCLERLSNPPCYTLLDYGAMIFFSLALLILLSLIIKSLQVLVLGYKAMIVIFKFLKLLLRIIMRLCGLLSGAGKRASTRLYRALDEEDLERDVAADRQLLDNNVRRPAVLNTRRAKAVLGPKLMYLIVTGLMFCFTSKASACTSSVNYIFDDNTCVITDNKETCTPTSKVLLSLGGLNTDTCLSMKRSNSPVGSIRIRIVGLKVRCSEENLYWTFKAEPYETTHCHCWGSGFCKEKDCQRTKLSAEQEKALGTNVSFVGIKGCGSSDSSLFSKCVGFSGCCYYKAGLIPVSRDEVYAVSQCSNMFYELDVNLQTKLGAGLPVDTLLTLSAGYPKTVSGLEISFSNPSIPWKEAYELCVVRPLSKASTHLVTCNKRSELIKGRLGEIKCPTLESATEKRHLCQIADGLVSPIKEHDNLEFKFSTLSLTNILKHSALPKVSSSYVADYDNRGVWFSESFSQTFNLHLMIPEVTIVPIQEKPKCHVSFVKARGCYSCMEGAEMELEVSCDGYPAVGTIQCNQLEHEIPFVANRKGALHIKFSVSMQKTNCEAQWKLGKSVGNFTLKGTYLSLVYSDSLLETKFSNSASEANVTASNSWFKSFGSFFSLRAVWETILSFLLIVGFTWLTIKFIIWRCSRRERPVKYA